MSSTIETTPLTVEALIEALEASRDGVPVEGAGPGGMDWIVPVSNVDGLIAALRNLLK